MEKEGEDRKLKFKTPPLDFETGMVVLFHFISLAPPPPSREPEPGSAWLRLAPSKVIKIFSFSFPVFYEVVPLLLLLLLLLLTVLLFGNRALISATDLS